MQSHARDMKLARAVVIGLVLLVASSVLVVFGDQASDAVVIAGAVGIVVAAALLGLTALAARWREGAVRYTSTIVDVDTVDSDVIDLGRPIAAPFDDAVGVLSPREDSAAM